jgi:hypothetical protein
LLPEIPSLTIGTSSCPIGLTRRFHADYPGF